MNYVYAALAGLAFGAAGAFLNYRITLAAIKKGTNKALSLSNLVHTVVNIAVLALVFFLRNILPFDFMACIVATAVGLSLCTIVFSFMAAKEVKMEVPPAKTAEVATETAEGQPEPEKTDD